MKKQGRIARRTLLGMFALALVLMAGIGAVIGIQVQKEMVNNYTNTALAYTEAAADFIDGDTIERYVTTGQKDAEYEMVMRHLEVTAEQAGIQYFYVFVPNENDITYVWDAEPGDEPMLLLEQEAYSDESAKEEAKKLFEGTATEHVNYFRDGENYVITASSVIYNSAGKPVAIAAADLSVKGIMSAARRVVFSVLLSSFGIMMVTMIIYFIFIKKKLVDPVVKLQKATGEIVDNIEKDKTLTIDIHTNDEIEMLAESFEKMETNLRQYIQQNEVITADKERIVTELELATKIQADMLPNIFPAFPERGDFDIYASMTPAKAVGGDFYDFFLTDETHLAIVIADVSGKGVPAALFMMMSRILLQNAAMSGLSPAKVLEKVNAHICSNNREEMFVTVWLGILDLETGNLIAANAGHEKPMVMQPDGEFEFYRDKNGFVIGGISGMCYNEYEMNLKKGAKLFVYTDGVVEATNAQDELFGIQNTLNALNEVRDKTPQKILMHIQQQVDLFVGDEPQFDDLTMLCMEYTGTPNELHLDADLEHVGAAVAFVSFQAAKLPFSVKAQNHIEMAVDEIVSNVARYAYEGGEGTASVVVDSDDSSMSITVIDSGIPYNPLEKKDPDVTLSADERGIGGYGIFLVTRIMDGVEYRYEDGKNIFTMRKNFTEQ